MNKRFYLTSLGYKILSTICAIGTLMIAYSVIFLVDNFILLAVIFSIFAALFCLFAMYISYKHKIIIKNNMLIIKHLRTHKIYLSAIENIHLNDKSLLQINVIFIKTKNKTFRINGYNSLITKNKEIKSQKIICELLKKIKLNN